MSGFLVCTFKKFITYHSILMVFMLLIIANYSGTTYSGTTYSATPYSRTSYIRDSLIRDALFDLFGDNLFLNVLFGDNLYFTKAQK